MNMESFTQDTVESVVIGSQRYGGIKAPYFKPKIRAKINMWPNDLSISLIYKVGMEKPIEGSDKYEAFCNRTAVGPVTPHLALRLHPQS